MQWCGMIHEPGINYKNCPYECAKQKAFWGAAAKKVKSGLIKFIHIDTRYFLPHTSSWYKLPGKKQCKKVEFLFQMAERSEGIVYVVINGTRQHWKDKQIFSAYMMDR